MVRPQSHVCVTELSLFQDNSVEVIVGRKVFVATACSTSVCQPLLAIRSRSLAREASAHGLKDLHLNDTLRAVVPLTKPGKWRPFRRRSADWATDSADTSATVYLQLASPHNVFSSQCVMFSLRVPLTAIVSY